jgi:hypothetical protein
MPSAASIALHKYSGAYLPTKRGKGLDWTLGEDAVALGRQTGYDYALFLHAEDSFASTGRVACRCSASPAASSAFARPNVGGAGQFAYASLVDLGLARWSGSTCFRPAARSPGSRWATSAPDAGARRWSTGCSTG